MKKYLYIGISVLLLILSISLIFIINKSNKYKTLYEKELQNVEAYKLSNSGLSKEIKQYQMTIDELEISKDSIDKKLINTINKLNISKKDILELQYQVNTVSKEDTIVLKDTIFIKDTHIDTTYGDEWYNMCLRLDYPTTIIAIPTFNSKQSVFIYTKEEYVGGKSKCFIINWFKKKYTSVEVLVEEENPYINLINQKFIKVEN